MGVVVTTRPDAIVLYFGHNNVWDIRIAENNREKIGTFKEVFSKVKAIPDTLSLLTQDPWYREYSQYDTGKLRKTLSASVPLRFSAAWFRPQECRDDWTPARHFQRYVRSYSEYKGSERRSSLQVFTDMTRDKLWMRLVDQNGESV